jgi:hypothetical protein
MKWRLMTCLSVAGESSPCVAERRWHPLSGDAHTALGTLRALLYEPPLHLGNAKLCLSPIAVAGGDAPLEAVEPFLPGEHSASATRFASSSPRRYASSPGLLRLDPLT